MSSSTQHDAGHASGYRLYWVTWVLLLVITVIMLALEIVSAPAWLLVILLLVGMMAKAGIIAGNFMHLRFEKPVLIWIVAASLLFISIAMFAYMAFDAKYILNHSAELPLN